MKLSAAARDQMYSTGMAALPREATGVLFGHDQFVPLRNVSPDPFSFAIDPDEFEHVVADRVPTAFFHTHPTDIAAPSVKDQDGASEWPEVRHLILSLKDRPELRCWRIFEGQVMPEPLEII